MRTLLLGAALGLQLGLLAACPADDPAESAAPLDAGVACESDACLDLGAQPDLMAMTCDTCVDSAPDTSGGFIDGTNQIVVGMETPLAVLDHRFLSFTMDTDRAVRQGFDFERSRLHNLTAELAPAYLRIGGTKADQVYYDLSESPGDAPDGFNYVMTRETFDGICAFAEALELDLLFDLNVGPGPRDEDGDWTSDNARELMEYAVAHDCPVAVWELGNEIGAFPIEYGLGVSGANYAESMRTLRALRDDVHPEGLIAGPASAYWPVNGEVLVPVMEDFLAAAGDAVDIVTWHYYPQQSSGCPVASRPITEEPLSPEDLDELNVWATEVESLTATHAPQAEVWLGETGHAQCGGEEGISDRFVSGLWWLDQLGSVARRGQPVVIRQALSGGNYQLIDNDGLVPRADYYNSVMWQRLMGATVLTVQAATDVAPTLRMYAHCTPGRPGVVTLLALNLDAEVTEQLSFDAALGGELEVYAVGHEGILGAEVLLDGTPLEVNADGTMPTLEPAQGASPVSIAPHSYSFIVFPEAGARACD